MSIHQQILDALAEGPATKGDIGDAMEQRAGSLERALRQLLTAGDIESLPGKRGAAITYRALRAETTVIVRTTQGVSEARVYRPGVDPKPDWLSGGEA